MEKRLIIIPLIAIAMMCNAQQMPVSESSTTQQATTSFVFNGTKSKVGTFEQRYVDSFFIWQGLKFWQQRQNLIFASIETRSFVKTTISAESEIDMLYHAHEMVLLYQRSIHDWQIKYNTH